METGLSILNVSAGDIKLVFDKNTAERLRAARIVKDMLRRGYALLVETGRDEGNVPTYTRVVGFDEEKCEYIIADFDSAAAAEADAKEPAHEPVANEPRVGKPKRSTKRVPADSTRGVAVARVAGG